MRRRAFEQLVSDAIADIPSEFLDRLENVEIVIEDEPSEELLEEMGLDPETDTLFGLYQGMPLTARGATFGPLYPDRITIFQGPIEEECDDIEEMIREIRRTVVHEIAHHFGISDARLEELGYG